MSNSNLCFTNKKSNYNIRFINDKTIKDGSVYTIKGKKEIIIVMNLIKKK